MTENSTSRKSSIDHQEHHDEDHSQSPDAHRGKNRTSTGKRKYHSKSRNGCSTCKRRRVKCDEVRPICTKCKNLKLDCGYLHDDSNQNSDSHHQQQQQQQPSPPTKKRKFSKSGETIKTQQATPSLTPSPSVIHDKVKTESVTAAAPEPSLAQSMQQTQQPQPQQAPPNNTLNALASGLLSAGNLNNINVARLVNDLSSMSDLSALSNLGSMGNLANLSSLATLAQFPIDLSNLGSLLDSGGLAAGMAAAATAAAAARIVPPTSSSSATSTAMPSASSSTHGNNNTVTPLTPNTSSSLLSEIEAEQQQMGYTNLSMPKNNINDLPDSNQANGGDNGSVPPSIPQSNLNMQDLRLMFHYTSQVASTITGAGISDTNIWNFDIPMLAFNYPFLMHSLLAFSATHLSRTESGLDQCVTCHRGNALRLLREAVLNINPENTDALVASALILIMDSLANASFPSSTSPISLPASAWIFHVKGAATILTAVWPLTEASRFYKFISVDLGDLGDIINQRVNLGKKARNGSGDSEQQQQRFYTDLECHDSDIADLYPVEIDSPYLMTLAYLNKLHKERYKSDFILRIFAFPALLDKVFLTLLMSGDVKAMRIMRSYYKLLRAFTTEMKDKVWFLEGVSQVLPVNVEEYAGGAGGINMMLDFLGGGPAMVEDELEDSIVEFDAAGNLNQKLPDMNGMPSEITSGMEVMQGDNGFMNIR